MAAGNKAKGIVVVETDAGSWTIQFTINGLCAIEDESDFDSAQAFIQHMAEAGQAGALSFKAVRLLFWAGLVEHHPEVSLQDAGRVVTAMGGPVAAMERLDEILSAAFPPGSVGDPPGAAPGKGAAAA